MAEETPKKKVLFAVGNKRIIFSSPSFAFSTEEIDKEEDEIESEPVSTTSGSPPASPKDDASASPKDDASASPSYTARSLDPDPNQWNGFLRKLNPTTSLQGLHPALHAIKRLTRKKSTKLTESIPPLTHGLDSELHCFAASWKNFSLAELKAATNHFSPENLIGEGGYSEVYKGHLHGGQLIAVKRVIRGTPEEMTSDFLSELGILVHVNHPNIANVIGYGVEGGMHLVLPLSQHGSLASLLRGEKEKLDWGVRYNIALGTASGLSYLHEGCQRRIIHRDIKAANILISEDFKPKISDFGLAKWLPDQLKYLTVSQFEGTFGYLAPEVFMNGLIDEKTDVYAYGVVLLELITGRPAVDDSQQSVVMWAKPLIASKDFQELLDPQLSDACDMEQLHCIVIVASQCLHQIPSERPKMGQVYRMLTGDEGILDSNKKFQKRTAFRKGKSMDLLEEDFDESDLLEDDPDLLEDDPDLLEDDLNQQNQIASEP
ncbi:hypothetical protein OSB04_022080 [Centaurea solstitialis]|uniref:non-specific serine/threonine protein kinase n=1 Tax=Centaurea solstitialis TaxID=347529 RepID=A0AA38TDT0_9ASTR|nr:hypothetical protein OSB04_022080 [Centaurea solstitialis]